MSVKTIGVAQAIAQREKKARSLSGCHTEEKSDDGNQDVQKPKMGIPGSRADHDDEIDFFSLPLELSGHFICCDSALAETSQKIRPLGLNSADYFNERS